VLIRSCRDGGQNQVQTMFWFHAHTPFIGVCYQKFPDWPPGARTANDTALCHKMQFYLYFVSHSSEFCRHNPSCCFSTSVCCLFRFRLSPKTFGYILVSCLSKLLQWMWNYVSSASLLKFRVFREISPQPKIAAELHYSSNRITHVRQGEKPISRTWRWWRGNIKPSNLLTLQSL